MTTQKLKITQIKSSIGRKPKHRATLRGLGLRKINHTVLREDTPSIRGMTQKVYYMIDVQEVNE